MPKQKVSREFIIQQALKIFRQKSYHNTTMADIAGACGLLKGSIYHYFASKEDLVRAVMDYVHSFFKAEVFVHAYNQELTPEERMKGIIKGAERLYMGPEGGCVMGNIGLETAHVNPEFSEPIRSFFRDYIRAFKTIYAEKFPEQQAQELAEQGMAELEGALMLSRIYDKKDFFVSVNRRLIDRINVYQTTV